MRKHLRSLMLLLLTAGTQLPAAAPPAKSIVYTNKRYHFRVTLPYTWKGYSVQSGDPWNGTPILHGELQEDPARQERGPVLHIHNPRWTRPLSYEDIPIMIFTRAQWAMVENDALITGAAPFPPSELARNKEYVFALPARYNYDYSPGWQEVETILAGHPVHAF